MLDGTNKEALAPKAIYLLAGSATDKILPALDKADVIYNGPYPSLDAMLGKLKSDLESADEEDPDIKPPVVFSPGATSFGMFNNEFDRGEKFMSAVKNLLR